MDETEFRFFELRADPDKRELSRHGPSKYGDTLRTWARSVSGSRRGRSAIVANTGRAILNAGNTGETLSRWPERAAAGSSCSGRSRRLLEIRRHVARDA